MRGASLVTFPFLCYNLITMCGYSSGDRAPASGAGCAGSIPAGRTIYATSTRSKRVFSFGLTNRHVLHLLRGFLFDQKEIRSIPGLGNLSISEELVLGDALGVRYINWIKERYQ